MNKEVPAQNTAAKEMGGDSMEIYTVADIASILQVRKGYVYELIYTGKLQAVRLSTRRVRITKTALDDFLHGQVM